MSLLALLFAEEETKKADQPPPGGPFGNPMFLFVMMGLFLFTMFWLPQRKQKKEQAAMMASLKRGSKVVTASGIIGTIASIKDGDEEVVIRSEDAKIKITRTSIVRVLGMEEEAKT
jgi:preprotein translocase subunit YajC